MTQLPSPHLGWLITVLMLSIVALIVVIANELGQLKSGSWLIMERECSENEMAYCVHHQVNYLRVIRKHRFLRALQVDEQIDIPEAEVVLVKAPSGYLMHGLGCPVLFIYRDKSWLGKFVLFKHGVYWPSRP